MQERIRHGPKNSDACILVVTNLTSHLTFVYFMYYILKYLYILLYYVYTHVHLPVLYYANNIIIIYALQLIMYSDLFIVIVCTRPISH